MFPLGPSDLNVILGIITNFLHEPYNSVEDPLDLWFHDLPKKDEIRPFSIGYSVGMGKASAAMSIIHGVLRLRSLNEMSDDELVLVGAQVAALINIKSMTDPTPNIEQPVEKSIGKKFRVTDRPRPHALQLYTAFVKIMEYKKALKGLSTTHHRRISREQCSERFGVTLNLRCQNIWVRTCNVSLLSETLLLYRFFREHA